MRARIGSIAVGLLLVLTACGTESEPPRSATSDPAYAADGTTTLPDSWRWEGFAGVLVGVPGDWGWGNSNQRIGQWCVGEEPLTPIVGRPGASTLVGCQANKDGVDPSSLVEHTGIVVGFNLTYDDSGESSQGDQVVRVLGDVTVTINAPAELREQIAATLHVADVDANGCAMRLPPGFRPGDRPSPGRDVSTLTGVTSLAACRYAILDPGWAAGKAMPRMPLLSSLRLGAEDAQEVVDAMAAAPEGGGPDNPDSCLPEYSYGDELIVALIESDQGRAAVQVTYSGCDHNGLDDGVTMRALTREAVRPLIVKANTLTSFSGGAAKQRILTR